ncbi:hypothetical protein [Galbibacter pacificus]|uniref:Phenylalanyl-tRNA synthetase subunit alpha n=1 Tax=Galbibacter pacificus TaxID=2996052 RepID=A0ABT6FTQ5_9FLAO|nr:hypothetical protein [Galbibacter pacificus]MDG3583168.1 hypothetical protein [Galbibacter pacificus]MDG3586649.1 hypothetical protein [Galbibacter pacificus]
MKKDIEIPVAENVYVAAVQEWDEKQLSKTWYVYLINNRETNLVATIVVSKGYGNGVITSTMRHGFGFMEAKSYRKIEILQEEVFKLKNEFFLTFFDDNKLYERKFVFEEYQISEVNKEVIPLITEEGVLAL